MTDEIIRTLREELRQAADEKTLSSAARYFKEQVVFYGVSSALTGKIVKKYFALVKARGKKEVFALCEDLFKSDYLEEAFIAADWAYRFYPEYAPEDFALFERWLHLYINNWAKCDSFCNHAVGALVEKYPQFLEDLKRWAVSDNRWVRRASAVTLIIPAKKGMFLPDIFEIAGILLKDKDDLVQKGYGWMLKDASILHRDEVFEFVMRHKAEMPRTALRYAIERMPDEMKRKAMSKGT